MSSKNKTILIFGGGINQLELIREARKIGVQSIVIDPAKNSPGKVEADFFYRVDGNDYQTTKEIAQKHQVNGIVTGQMEKPMRIMAKLAREKGYIFHSPEVVERSLNKVLMKKAFLDHGVECAKFISFTENQEITSESIKKLSFPLIIKPADAFSSRGVVKVSDFNELKEYEAETRSFSTNSTLIVEEFLEGKEYSVECITFKGETNVIQVTEKFITPYPNTVEIAHLQPARITEVEKRQIEKLVKKTIDAIGIDNSASHAEVMLTKNGPYMIEVGARLGGDFIASYLTKASTGVSMDKAAIQVALGLKPDIQKKHVKCSMIKYIELEKDKTVSRILPINEIEKQSGFVFAHIFVNPGETIEKITHSAQRPACIIFQATDYLTLNSRLDKNEKLLKTKIILQ